MNRNVENDDLLPVPVSRLVPREVDWLWPNRLALGKLAILDGDPGLGKSLLALEFCARLSRGRPFPESTASQAPAASLVLHSEDTADDIIQPRLRALDADRERVFVPDGKQDSLRGPIRFPRHAAALDRALGRTGARLLVIDPIMAFLDRSIATASDQSVRRALFVLARLAERHPTPKTFRSRRGRFQP